jgi:antitoxin component YwqK of YwqJK toxin-antitoxin module
MKRITVILVLLFCVNIGFGQDSNSVDNVYTTFRSYYENGNLATEINYVNNLPVGEYHFYYPDGTIMEEGIWSEKHLTGNFKRYYENGQVSQEFYYDNKGNRVGKQKYFYQTGNIQAEKQMGPPEHIVIRYSTDGKEKIYISF